MHWANGTSDGPRNVVVIVIIIVVVVWNHRGENVENREWLLCSLPYIARTDTFLLYTCSTCYIIIFYNVYTSVYIPIGINEGNNITRITTIVNSVIPPVSPIICNFSFLYPFLSLSLFVVTVSVNVDSLILKNKNKKYPRSPLRVLSLWVASLLGYNI